ESRRNHTSANAFSHSQGQEQTQSLATENESLKYLRWHASYLAPGGDISIWSGVAVLLRTLLISVFFWLPLLITFMLAVFVVTGVQAFYDSYHGTGELTVSKLAAMTLWLPWIGWRVSAFAGVFIFAILLLLVVALSGTTLLTIVSILIPPETTENRGDRVARAWWCAAVGFAGLLICYFTRSGLEQNRNLDNLDPVTSTLLIATNGFGLFGTCSVIVGILQLSGILEFGVNYAMRRKYELAATWWFPTLIACVTFASLPFMFDAIADAIQSYPTAGKALIGILTLASGFLSGLYGHFVQAQRLAPSLVSRVAATLAAAAFLYLLLLIAYAGARFLIQPEHLVPDPASAQYCRDFFFALLVFSAAFGWWSNVNYLGLHRFYRDRLMEAFMPTNEQKAAEAPNYSDADRLALAAIWPPKQSAPLPYPLINTNVVLIKDPDQTTALRGGDSFLLSPCYVGSFATGWLPTSVHDKKHGPMTLASAMAASGAAANANAGYIGTGITRDWLISTVMMLFNLRLGLWIGAPGATSGTPNYFSPGLKYGVFRSGYQRNSTFLELTDGGHFDNLGAYELIRRRCDVVIVLDSEEDPSTAMSALASVCQRVREDFGVLVKIEGEADAIAPAGDMGYPAGAKFAKKSYFVASIDYPAEQRSGIEDQAKTGTFVYLKSGMIKQLSFSTKGYKAKFPEFPNQSTVDQFFDSAQFEAYRDLGWSSVEAMTNAFGLDAATDAGDFVRRMTGAPPFAAPAASAPA
ncbi:hypothetical protein, partial [uncultured Bradyrhizobium sp.]|uniref:hypothetical protein n=1 Tax=uncultured Bradyrhizobium sp. TaxID=199684 RepID=UPI002611ACE8